MPCAVPATSADTCRAGVHDYAAASGGARTPTIAVGKVGMREQVGDGRDHHEPGYGLQGARQIVVCAFKCLRQQLSTQKSTSG
jgi:hypothetical protein